MWNTWNKLSRDDDHRKCNNEKWFTQIRTKGKHVEKKLVKYVIDQTRGTLNMWILEHIQSKVTMMKC